MVPANRADPGPWAGRWASSDTSSSSSSSIAEFQLRRLLRPEREYVEHDQDQHAHLSVGERQERAVDCLDLDQLSRQLRWAFTHRVLVRSDLLPFRSGTPQRLGTECWPGYTNAVQTGEAHIVGFESITDGTSNTALFSEKMVGLNGFVATALPGSPNGKRVSFQTSINSTWDDPNGPAVALQFLAACKGMPSSTQPTNPTQWTGACWDGSHAGTLHFNAYDHFNTPNGLSCVAANSWGGPPGGFNDIITATSNHPGGVNVCMGDGSVKFIKDSISPTTWWALGTRDGSELISSDAY